MPYYAPYVDHELRDRGLGQVASTPISVLPAPQIVATGAAQYLENAFAAGLQLVWPSIPPAAEVVAGTLMPATVIRLYQEMEGVIDVEFTLQFQDQTAGAAVWTISAINGTLLNTVGQTILTTVTVSAGAAVQNSFVNARFRNRAYVAPFPGMTGGRRSIDTAILIQHDQPGNRTMRLWSMTALATRVTYQ